MPYELKSFGEAGFGTKFVYTPAYLRSGTTSPAISGAPHKLRATYQSLSCRAIHEMSTPPHPLRITCNIETKKYHIL